MSFDRLVLHYGFDPNEFLGVLSEKSIKGCWFELLRQGGCGSGELRLNQEFASQLNIEPGHWIAFERMTGERWYFGRVEEVQCESPSGMRVLLEGPSIQLNEVFPGAFRSISDGLKPHRYGNTDLFGDDPDYAGESFDLVGTAAELVRKLIEQYVAPTTWIKNVPSMIDTSTLTGDVTSVKFRGEESVRSIIKDLAMRAQNACWGVDAEGQFFFRSSGDALLATYDEGKDLTSLSGTRSRDRIFNRVTLTGDYIYDRKEYSSQIARRSYRWRGNYRQPASIANYGERRIRLWVPWIRTQEDSRAFVTEFLRTYSVSEPVYRFETRVQTSLPIPWEGVIQLRDRNLSELVRGAPERIRVRFDHAVRFQVELGPLDPRELWPEPPQDERFELPDGDSNWGESDFSFSDPPAPSSFVNSSSNGNSSGVGSEGSSGSSQDSIGSSLNSSGSSWSSVGSSGWSSSYGSSNNPGSSSGGGNSSGLNSYSSMNGSSSMGNNGSSSGVWSSSQNGDSSGGASSSNWMSSGDGGSSFANSSGGGNGSSGDLSSSIFPGSSSSPGSSSGMSSSIWNPSSGGGTSSVLNSSAWPSSSESQSSSSSQISDPTSESWSSSYSGA